MRSTDLSIRSNLLQYYIRKNNQITTTRQQKHFQQEEFCDR